MKIKDVKEIVKQSNKIQKEAFNLVDSNPEEAKKLFDKSMEIKHVIPHEIRINDLVNDLDGNLKNIVAKANDPELLKWLGDVSNSLKKIIPSGLDHFDDDVDAQSAIDRANKLKALM